MQKELIKRLTDYATFAAGVLVLINKADAEVIYTDIDPDVVLDTDGNYYAIDIDNNGTADFQFLKSTFSNYDFTFGYITYYNLWCGPINSSNAIAGFSNYYPYPGVLIYFPYALSMNENIDSKLAWQSNTIQLIAFIENIVGYNVHCFNCSWNGNSSLDVINHYFGIRFVTEEPYNHYGWIRCDVVNDGLKLIIKDYAYETEPDYPILAGSKATYQEIDPGNIEGEIYVSGSAVHISVPHRPTLEFTIEIFNIAGQNIYSSLNENPFVEIQLDVPPAIYIVTVTSGNEKMSKEVLIE